MSRGSRSRRGLVVALVFASLVLSGCADSARPVPSATALPQGVTASLIQLRSDVATREAQVRIVNGNDEPVTISSLRVDDPRFDGPARRAMRRTTQIAPGGTVDIRIALPPMKCSAERVPSLPAPVPTPVGDGPTVTVHYALGASDAVAAASLDEPVAFLDDLHARECLAEQLQDAAALSLSSFTPSEPGAPAELSLRIEPTGRGDARIVGIQTTNLLTFGDGAADTYRIGVDAGAASDAVVVPLPLLPLRCDPHAVQEDKRGTVFTVVVQLDGEAPAEIELAASEEMRGQILTWVGKWCGFAG